MNNLKEVFQHPTIVCQHQLDIFEFELFAIELSNRLCLDIEMYNYTSSNSYIKTIINNKAKGIKTLKEKRSILIPEIKYELKLDEISLMIYNDFIEITFDNNLDYFHLKQLNDQHKLVNIGFFSNFLNQLKLLEIDEVYFGVFIEFDLDKNLNYSWKNVHSEISKKNNFFKLTL